MTDFKPKSAKEASSFIYMNMEIRRWETRIEEMGEKWGIIMSKYIEYLHSILS